MPELSTSDAGAAKICQQHSTERKTEHQTIFLFETIKAIICRRNIQCRFSANYSFTFRFAFCSALNAAELFAPDNCQAAYTVAAESLIFRTLISESALSHSTITVR